jgi:hypothetical protein
MFIDETGDASVRNDDPRFNIFVLCGVLFSEAEYASFEKAFKALKIKYFNNDAVVFHSVEMRKKSNAFKIFQNEQLLQKFYAEIGRIFRNSRYLVFSCVVDKPGYRTKYPEKNFAYEEALMYMCERGISSIGGMNSGHKLHLCLEKRGKDKDRSLKLYYTDFIRYGTHYVSTYDFQVCNPTIHFRGKQENTNGLQFADLIAYPIARKHLSPDRPQPTYDLFSDKIYSKFGKIEGFGIKYFP